jgi:hypothetical protein
MQYKRQNPTKAEDYLDTARDYEKANPSPIENQASLEKIYNLLKLAKKKLKK